MPPPLAVPPAAARLFLRRVHGFDAPLPDLASALARHGYIQIDPINVCGRMHDLILRNRVAGYREGDLMRFLHESENSKSQTPNSKPAAERRAFEHHLPNTGVLVAFPLEAWPHLLGAMHQWSRARGAWAGRLTPREKTLAEELLREITARGPLGSIDFDDDRTARRVWGASRLVKATLQKMFFHGRILIAQRVNNHRRYDLPARVLPAATLTLPAAPAADTARWLVLLKLRQRRLTALTRQELRLVADIVQPVAIQNCPLLFCLPQDVPLLEAAMANRQSPIENPIRLLAPLDPIIYDRRVTSALWDFDYTWEAYTPPRKRVRGYYALPILVGTELVGHVDPKADREARKLVVRARRVRRGHATAPALREFAQWLGLRR